MQKSFGRNNNNDIQTIFDKLMTAMPHISKEVHLNNAVSMYVAVNEGPKLTNDLTEVTKSLGFEQIEIAAIGTFIWAFGDLLL